MVSTLDAPTSYAPPLETAPATRLTRSQVLERIITINPTAAPDFLARFNDMSLSYYLERLLVAQGPRCRTAGWVRPGDTPGIMMAEPD